MPKTDSKAAVQDPTLCSEDPQAVWNGSDLLQMQRRQKPNTRNRPEKKKKKTETRTRRRERQTKEPTRRLQGNWQAISEVVELRMEKKADLMKS